MCWRRIEIEVLLLDVLAVIAFVPRQPKKPFLQNSIAPIPHRQAETNHLVPVAYTSDPVFAPPVCSRPRVIVREKLPRRAVGAVILPHLPPLPLPDIPPPPLPPPPPPSTPLHPPPPHPPHA